MQKTRTAGQTTGWVAPGSKTVQKHQDVAGQGLSQSRSLSKGGSLQYHYDDVVHGNRRPQPKWNQAQGGRNQRQHVVDGGSSGTECWCPRAEQGPTSQEALVSLHPHKPWKWTQAHRKSAPKHTKGPQRPKATSPKDETEPRTKEVASSPLLSELLFCRSEENTGLRKTAKKQGGQ